MLLKAEFAGNGLHSGIIRQSYVVVDTNEHFLCSTIFSGKFAATTFDKRFSRNGTFDIQWCEFDMRIYDGCLSLLIAVNNRPRWQLIRALIGHICPVENLLQASKRGCQNHSSTIEKVDDVDIQLNIPPVSFIQRNR